MISFPRWHPLMKPSKVPGVVRSNCLTELNQWPCMSYMKGHLCIWNLSQVTYGTWVICNLGQVQCVHFSLSQEWVSAKLKLMLGSCVFTRWWNVWSESPDCVQHRPASSISMLLKTHFKPFWTNCRAQALGPTQVLQNSRSWMFVSTLSRVKGMLFPNSHSCWLLSEHTRLKPCQRTHLFKALSARLPTDGNREKKVTEGAIYSRQSTDRPSVMQNGQGQQRVSAHWGNIIHISLLTATH